MQVPGATATEKQLLAKKTDGDMGAGTGKKKLGSGSDLSKEEKIGEEVQYSGDQDVQHSVQCDSTVQYSTVLQRARRPRACVPACWCCARWSWCWPPSPSPSASSSRWSR